MALGLRLALNLLTRIVSGGGGLPPVANGVLLEDGVSFVLLEDGVSILLLE